MTDDGCCDPVPLGEGGSSGAARRLAVTGFVALWRGERAKVADLCDAPAVVDAQQRAGRLEVEDTGIVVGVHGLTARTTLHRVEHGNAVAHTWCALDAIGIPAALAIDATAATSCPTCDAELSVVLRAGEPVDADHSLRLWLPEGRCDHLVEDFCSHAKLYCSPAHLTADAPDRPPGRELTVADAVAIGRHTWADAAAALHTADGSL